MSVLIQPPWHLGRMAALDFESSDKNPATARIVTCALIEVGGGEPTVPRTWLLNPGVPMNPEAIAVHGITDAYAAEHGVPAEVGVKEIAEAVAEVVRSGVVLVGHNISYDLTLLDAECTRYGLDSLAAVCGRPLSRVIDTMVIDRHTAPFRRRVSETQGPYQLRTTVETYGLAWDDDAAHAADYDAMQSARVAWLMGSIAHSPAEQRPAWVRNLRDGGARFDLLAGVTLEELFARQQVWHRQWATDFQEYRRRSNPDAVVNGDWPVQGGASC